MKSQIARSNEYSFCHLSKIHKDFPKFNISKSNTNEPLFFNSWTVFPKILYDDTFVHYSFGFQDFWPYILQPLKETLPLIFTGIFECGYFDELISYFVGISKKTSFV